MPATNDTEELHSPIDDFSINTYEVPVQLELEGFDSYEQLELAVCESVANAIVAHEYALDEGDASYISTRVTFDTEGAKQAFEDEDTTHATLETKTPLGVLDDGD